MAPPAPASCAVFDDSFSSNVGLPILDGPGGGAPVESTIEVSGAGSYLSDVDATTEISHTFSSDLDVTLTSPEGTTVTLTSDNGTSLDDVFNGTQWDDDSDPDGALPYTVNDGLASDHAYVNGVAAIRLVPEEPMAAFIGENPNGTWRLAVRDDAGGESGTLSTWGLSIRTLQAAPIPSPFSAHAGPGLAIPDNAPPVTTTLDVSAAGGYLFDLDLTTALAHPSPADVDMTLTSPAGTVVTLTTDNGAAFDDVFNGTVWDDGADPDGVLPYPNTGNPGMVTDNAYSGNVVATPLTPEEAMGAFIGEDPNGTWTLTMRDDTGTEAGTLASWSLAGQTSVCQGPSEVTVGDAKTPERRRKPTTVKVPVTLSAPSSETVEVTYETAPASARRRDFKRASGLISISPGETEKMIKLELIGDRRKENREIFSVVLTPFSNAIIVRGSGFVTIKRSDY